MKTGALLRHLRRHGCVLKREGGSHALWTNPNTGQVEVVPRHTEIPNILARKICRGLLVAEGWQVGPDAWDAGNQRWRLLRAAGFGGIRAGRAAVPVWLSMRRRGCISLFTPGCPCRVRHRAATRSYRRFLRPPFRTRRLLAVRRTGHLPARTATRPQRIRRTRVRGFCL